MFLEHFKGHILCWKRDLSSYCIKQIVRQLAIISEEQIWQRTPSNLRVVWDLANHVAGQFLGHCSVRFSVLFQLVVGDQQFVGRHTHNDPPYQIEPLLVAQHIFAGESPVLEAHIPLVQDPLCALDPGVQHTDAAAVGQVIYLVWDVRSLQHETLVILLQAHCITAVAVNPAQVLAYPVEIFGPAQVICDGYLLAKSSDGVPAELELCGGVAWSIFIQVQRLHQTFDNWFGSSLQISGCQNGFPLQKFQHKILEVVVVYYGIQN